MTSRRNSMLPSIGSPWPKSNNRQSLASSTRNTKNKSLQKPTKTKLENNKIERNYRGWRTKGLANFFRNYRKRKNSIDGFILTSFAMDTGKTHKCIRLQLNFWSNNRNSVPNLLENWPTPTFRSQNWRNKSSRRWRPRKPNRQASTTKAHSKLGHSGNAIKVCSK